MKKTLLLIAFLLVAKPAWAVYAFASSEVLDLQVDITGDYIDYNNYPEAPHKFSYEYGDHTIDFDKRTTSATANGEWQDGYSYYQERRQDWFWAMSDVDMHIRMEYRLTAKADGTEYNALAFSDALVGYFKGHWDEDFNEYWESGYEVAALDGFGLLDVAWAGEYTGVFDYTIHYEPLSWGTWFLQIDSLSYTDGFIYIPDDYDYDYYDDCGEGRDPVPEPSTLFLFGLSLAFISKARPGLGRM